LFVTILWVLGLAIAGTATWYGLPYYLTPLAERPFSPLHDLFAPTGLVGHGFGIVGTLLVVVGVTLYTARKRIPFLARVGKLRDWLHFHIFLCLVGPFLVLLHTTFRFGGLVAISFWSMAAVVSSGVFGRYVYSWIPRTISGGATGAEAVRDRMRAVFHQVEETTSLSKEHIQRILWPGRGEGSRATKSTELGRTGNDGPARATPVESGPEAAPVERRRRPRQPGILGAALEALAFRLTRRKRLRRFDRELRTAGVTGSVRSEMVGLLNEEARIEQQLRILQPFQRAFRYWHAFHLPLAGVMFLVLGVHVAVALAFGYTWIF
jgi:hypothetical protein